MPEPLTPHPRLGKRIRCPACQTLLSHAFVARHAAQSGVWHCPNCGIRLEVAVIPWLITLPIPALPLATWLSLGWPWQLGLGAGLLFSAVYLRVCGHGLAWLSSWFGLVVQRGARPARIRPASAVATWTALMLMLALLQAS